MEGKTMLFFVAFVFFVTTSVASDVTFKECPSAEGIASKLDITPCESQPCVFHRGTNVTATVIFTPKETVTKSTIQVYGVIGPVPIPFPLPSPDGCKDHGLSCPLKPNVEVKLVVKLPVSKAYPALPALVVKFDLEDQDGKKVFCVEFPASIA